MSFQFLSELFQPYDTDAGLLCEIRSIAPNREGGVHTSFFTLARLAEASRYAKTQAKTQDVYMGVLPRFCKPVPGQAGQDAHVNCAGWLWCDIDRGEATEAETAAFLTGLKARIPRPRLIVFSGSGGVHLYWRLIKPEPIEQASFRTLLRRLVLLVGSGPADLHADKSCVNPSRILRVPFTHNHKHVPPVRVWGGVCADYDALALDGWNNILPMEPLPARLLRPKFTPQTDRRFEDKRFDGPAPGLVRWAEAGYAEGNRHHDLVGAAAWLRRDTDLDERVAYDLFVLKAASSPGRRAITPQEIEAAWNWAG